MRRLFKERPIILIPKIDRTVVELQKRWSSYSFSLAAQTLFNLLTRESSGGDEIQSVGGLEDVAAKDECIGVTISHPETKFGSLGRMYLRNFKGVKPLVEVVRIPKFTPEMGEESKKRGSISLPVFPENGQSVTIRTNGFGEINPNTLYAIKIIIISPEVTNDHIGKFQLSN